MLLAVHFLCLPSCDEAVSATISPLTHGVLDIAREFIFSFVLCMRT